MDEWRDKRTAAGGMDGRRTDDGRTDDGWIHQLQTGTNRHTHTHAQHARNQTRKHAGREASTHVRTQARTVVNLAHTTTPPRPASTHTHMDAHTQHTHKRHTYAPIKSLTNTLKFSKKQRTVVCLLIANLVDMLTHL